MDDGLGGLVGLVGLLFVAEVSKSALDVLGK